MFCTRCGRDTQDRDTYCPSCGVALKDAPLMPQQSRIAGHLRMLGILWLALSGIRFVPGLVLLVLVDHGLFQNNGAPPFVSSLVEGVAVTFLILAMAGVGVGWGLIARQPWARMAAIVLGSCNLVDVPFGTALGAYTLWVLLPVESEEQYRRIAGGEFSRGTVERAG